MLVAKVRTAKISSGASGGIFAKVCTCENFPLYGTLRNSVVSIYGHGEAGVRDHHMSRHNCAELDAPSPRFAGLMRSCIYFY